MIKHAECSGEAVGMQVGSSKLPALLMSISHPLGDSTTSAQLLGQLRVSQSHPGASPALGLVFVPPPPPAGVLGHHAWHCWPRAGQAAWARREELEQFGKKQAMGAKIKFFKKRGRKI